MQLNRVLYTLFINLICFFSPLMAQRQDAKEFDNMVDSYLSFSIPTIKVVDLKTKFQGAVLLDAREKEEYNVSHIPGALYLGYEKVNYDVLEGLPKNTPLVIYCSIGYRSEKLGEKLKKRGFTKVVNLYGSIFAWANEGNKLVDANNKSTYEIHTYNKKWSKWVINPELKKVY